MSDEREVDSESGGRKVGPGERLQAARIEQGLALGDLANQMHLSTAILESLEENRFEDITAPIFVKGYLRSYARIVGLDETEILDLYVEEYMDSDPPISSTSSDRVQRQRARSGGRGRWWLVLLVLAVAIGGWWYQRSQQDAQTISLDAGAESSADMPTEVAETPVVRELAKDASRRLEQLEPVTASEVPQESVAASAPPIDEPAEESPQSAVTPEPIPTATETPSTSSESAQPPESAPKEVVEPTVAEPVAKTGTETVAGGQGLSLRVTADTWADIRDASGRKLVYDLLRAGRKLDIEGRPPLRLFFGNGHGVELSWKGKPVDLASRIRADNTVRLTLE